jgi:hypothetical protein
MGSSNCIFLVDIAFYDVAMDNYGVKSYIDYAKRNKIDLIIQRNVNPNYVV